jgi:hemerythrin-like domain-containing protein
MTDRRAFLAGTAAIIACHSTPPPPQGEVTATEDLMREHGVIRRVLVVYRECASRVRAAPTAQITDAVQRAASLMRRFGEDYHEKQLEEAHIFPALANADTKALLAQHQRGREITDWVLAVTKSPIDATNADALARTLEGFARMYEEHAAIEDTVVFPAWKKTLSSKQLDEIGDQFEDIEQKTLGKDGFESAVARVTEIEKSLGIGLAALLAPPPPR